MSSGEFIHHNLIFHFMIVLSILNHVHMSILDLHLQYVNRLTTETFKRDCYLPVQISQCFQCTALIKRLSHCALTIKYLGVPVS